MTDVPQGEDWWQASDGKWYPPTDSAASEPSPLAEEATVPVYQEPVQEGIAGPEAPAPGWWQASDGRWYPPSETPGYGAQAPVYGAAPGYGQANYDPQAKSKLVAGLLGILVGGFGVHRFYLGYTQIGIIQIVVTILTCGIGALWGFIEGILILVGNESFRTDADGRPLRD